MSDVPSRSAVQAEAAPPTVTDHRPVPRGVLPRGMQTWIMVGIAAAMLVIMLVVGRPEAPARAVPAVPTTQAPSADRVRDYQDRLRLLEAQALRDQSGNASAEPVTAPDEELETAPPPPDPVAEERKRREYESLFASNVVLSRRPQNERPDGERTGSRAGATSAQEAPANPSVDDVAEAVVRAAGKTAGAFGPSAGTAVPTAVPREPNRAETTERHTPEYTPPVSASGPVYRVLEGTVIDAVLTNRLDGASAAPVNCLVTNPLYGQVGRQVLIPAGARVLGETRPVQELGETRLAVSFHRLLMPDGRTYRLDQFTGLNQVGDAGLRDRVNQHFLSTFGAAAAVGLISGLSQYLGSAKLGGGSGDRTVVIAGGAGDATSQATVRVMDRFLNRVPTVTIREGHRVKVYVTSDLELPAYVAPVTTGPF